MRSVTSLGSRSAAAWLLSLLVSLAAATAQDWRGPEDLEVRVEDAKGKPLAGAEVVLDYVTRELGGPAPQLTDAKGRLAVGGLAPGIWALEVRKPGFMSFRAEVALSGGERPQIVVASQHNVPGATSTLRVRLARAKGAPAAPSRVELAPPRVVSAVAPPPAPVSTASPAPTPAAPAPAPVATPPPPAAAPAAAAPPAQSAPPIAPAPAPAASPAPTPAAPAPTPAVAAPTPAVPAPTPAVATPTPAAPAPAPVPVAPSPAPPARVFAAAPIARACYECRPGESALLAEAEVGAGGAPCPADLAQRLAGVPLAELPALAAGLPAGCAVLVVELPAHARYAGFRYEAAGDSGRSEDCLAGRACPAGGCRFPSEPVVRGGDGATVVLAPFESSARRRAGFTVYWRRTR